MSAYEPMNLYHTSQNLIFISRRFCFVDIWYIIIYYCILWTFQLWPNNYHWYLLGATLTDSRRTFQKITLSCWIAIVFLQDNARSRRKWLETN